MQENKLKILYLEDNESDADLIVSRLKADGFSVEVSLVSNRNEFSDRLANEAFDLILSDYNLPGYSGMEALNLARKESPDVPFICVSGAIGEDLAVEMLKQGAVDYVLKDKLGKLSLAIRRALNEVNERRNRDLAEREYRKLSQAVEFSPASISITNAEGVFEYVNPRFLEMTGYLKEEVIGATPSILKSGLTHPDVYKNLWDTILAGNVWRGEIINKTKQGAYYWVKKSISPITDDEGMITHFIAVGEDITTIKKNEEELIKAKERAIESDLLKSNFLANMSHEIRTPLNSIIGFSELIGDPDFSDEQKSDFIQTIIHNGNNLLSVISDIIDISKLDSGQLNIRLKQFSVSKLLNDIQKEFFFRAKKKGIELGVIHPLNLGEILLRSDEERLRQVLNNLVGNAIKFTDTGYIEISYYTKEQEVIFRVKDTGIGIPREFQHKIFERFRQVEDGITRKYGGNGLGLAITKNLVELLGGEIWVNSESGQGSSFYFKLPIRNMVADQSEEGFVAKGNRE